MLPIKKIERFVKMKTRNPESITHGFGHLKRTAMGAKWFAKIHNENKKIQDLSYLAGLLHDIVRPPSHNIEHDESAANKAKTIMKLHEMNEDDILIVYNAVLEHRGTGQVSNVDRYLFLSDKLFDLMGAMTIFRRCAYVGESYDYKGIEFKKAIIKQFRRKIKEYNPKKFNQFRKLANYQFGWVMKYFKALKNNEPWAIEIAKHCYDKDREHKLSLEKIIASFKPTKKESKLYKKEVVAYISGKKFKEFEKLI